MENLITSHQGMGEAQRPGFAWRRALMTGLYLLMCIPASFAIHLAVFMGFAMLPYDPDAPANLSTGVYFRDAFHLALFAVPAGVCLFTVYLQRGQPDRTSPFVLLALVLGVESITMGMAGMTEFGRVGLAGYPGDFILASIGVAYVSAALALVELVRLMLTRSPQRGRWIALGIVVSVGWAGFVQHKLIVGSQGLSAPRDGIELAEVPSGDLWPLSIWGGRKEQVVPLFVDIDANGGIVVDGHAVASAGSAALRERLALVSGPELGAAFLRLDARAPFEALVRVQAASMHPDVASRGFHCLVHLQDGRHPGWMVGGFWVYFARAQSGGNEAVSEPEPRERFVLRMLGSGTSTTYAFAEEEPRDLEGLLEALGEGSVGFGVELVLQAAPTREWQSITTLLAGLNSLQLEVSRFELLD